MPKPNTPDNNRRAPTHRITEATRAKLRAAGLRGAVARWGTDEEKQKYGLI